MSICKGWVPFKRAKMHIFRINKILCCEDKWSFNAYVIYYLRPKKIRCESSFRFFKHCSLFMKKSIWNRTNITFNSLLFTFWSWILSHMAGNNWISANKNLRILALLEGVWYDTALTGTHWQCEGPGRQSTNFWTCLWKFQAEVIIFVII